MCQSCGFGKAALSSAGEGHSDCILEEAFISNRDEEGLYIGSGSQHRSYCAAFEFQGSEASFLWWGFRICAGEPAFCAAYGGLIEEKTEVCCQAEASGVGQALAVHKEEVRVELEFLSGFDADRSFAEGEQSGYIWELNGCVCCNSFDYFEAGHF